MDVVIADDLDAVPPWVKEIEKAPRQRLDARFFQGHAHRLLIIHHQPEMPAIIGVTENLTEAEITFDRFHVMKPVSDAVDEVRRTEVKARPELKGTRYVWTKKPPNLTASQSLVLDTLAATNLKTARAWRMRLAFQDVYAQHRAHGQNCSSTNGSAGRSARALSQ